LADGPIKNGTHFIHKKQSQCNIRRVSGVTYIKKSESQQLNVRDRYEKLAPIAIQGSYHLAKATEALDSIDHICERIFFSPDSYLVCTAFDSANEAQMKNYILKPHKRREISRSHVWLVKAGGLAECWRFIKDKYFLCIHLLYDPQTLVRNIDLEDLKSESRILKYIEESDVCLGILTKRGNASVKSMLRVYHQELDSNPEADLGRRLGCPGAVISGINTIGLMLRIELFVDEHRWKSLNHEHLKST